MKNKRNWLIALGAFVVVGVVGLAVYSNQSGGLFKGNITNQANCIDMNRIYFSDSIIKFDNSNKNNILRNNLILEAKNGDKNGFKITNPCLKDLLKIYFNQEDELIIPQGFQVSVSKIGATDIPIQVDNYLYANPPASLFKGFLTFKLEKDSTISFNHNLKALSPNNDFSLSNIAGEYQVDLRALVLDDTNNTGTATAYDYVFASYKIKVEDDSCVDIDQIKFDPSEIFFDKNDSAKSKDTFLSIYTQEGEIGFRGDKICETSKKKFGLPDDISGFRLSVKDYNNKDAAKPQIITLENQNTNLYQDSIVISSSTENLNKINRIKFTNNLDGLSAWLDTNKKYTVELYVVDDKNTVSSTPIANYSIQIKEEVQSCTNDVQAKFYKEQVNVIDQTIQNTLIIESNKGEPICADFIDNLSVTVNDKEVNFESGKENLEAMYGYFEGTNEYSKNNLQPRYEVPLNISQASYGQVEYKEGYKVNIKGKFKNNLKFQSEFTAFEADTLPKEIDCIAIGKIAFNPNSLNLDLAKHDSKSTILNMYDKQGKSLGIPDGVMCVNDLTQLNIPEEGPQNVLVSLYDGSKILKSMNLKDLIDGKEGFDGLLKVVQDSKELTFTNSINSSINTKLKLELDKKYSIKLVNSNNQKEITNASYTITLNDSTPKPQEKVCVEVDSIKFTPDALIYNLNDSIPTTLDTFLSTFKGKTELGIVDNICSNSRAKLNLPDELGGFRLSIEGGNFTTLNSDIPLNDSFTGKGFNDFISFEKNKDETSNISRLAFHNNFEKRDSLGLKAITTYTVKLYAIDKDKKVEKYPISSYTVQIIPKVATYSQPTGQEDEQAEVKPPQDKKGCIDFDSAKFSPTSQTDATDKITFTYQFYDTNDKPVGFSIDGACYSSLIKWFGNNDTKIDDSKLKELIESSLSPQIVNTKHVISSSELKDTSTYFDDFLEINFDKNISVFFFTLDPNKLPKDMEKGQTYSLSFGKAAASFSFKGSQTKNGGDLGDENGGSAGTNNNDSGKKGTGSTTTTTTTPTTTQTPTPTPTKVTTPSAQPCIVGDKTFYLAEGPNSAYCKDLQALGSSVARVDQAPETPQVRYTTALFTQRIIADTIQKLHLDSKIKVRNLPNDWYNQLVDAKEISEASSEERSNFKSVYASSILRGRKDINTGEVTLDPLDRIKYIELFALLDQGVSSVIGYSPKVSDSNMPTFAVAYRNNKDTIWMYRAIAFGIEFNIISKNEFNQNTIQNYATREDMARFLARFQDTVEQNPKLLGGK